MSAEELIGVVREVLEAAYNQGNLAALEELCAADAIFHRPPYPDIEGLEAFREHVADLRRTFSDVRITFDEIIVQEETLARRWTIRGTHTGRSPSMPLPPTGRGVMITGCGMTHLLDGRIVEEWIYADWLGLFQQLGAIPPME